MYNLPPIITDNTDDDDAEVSIWMCMPINKVYGFW